ncbi:MAG: cell envelope biogenesis protein TonB [Saprospiraceae bacterium]|nr:MAG: cell envelope biogenesis protein TonB [Saprospiraceae bacterium]
MFIAYLLKVSICWLVCYVLYVLLFRSETFFRANRFYLLGSLVLGVLLPLVPLDSLWYTEATTVAYTFQPIVVGVESMGEAVVSASTSTGEGFPWGKALTAIYLAGVAFFTLRFFKGLLQLGRLRSQAKEVQSRPYHMYLTNEEHLPFSFFNSLYWSRHFEVDEVSRRQIILHEEAHIFQGHSYDVVLVELAGILLWWLPLPVLYKRELQNTHEFLADAYVIRKFSKKDYTRMLLRHSIPGNAMGLSNAIFSSQLKKRLIMMTKDKSTHLASLKYLATLPLLAFLLISFSNGKTTNSTAHTEIHPASMYLTDTIPADASSANEEPIFKMVEEMPRFQGCEDLENLPDPQELRSCSDQKMLEFIYNNIKYPKEAIEAGIEGMVVVNFIIEKDGSITGEKIVRDIGGGCGEEALRIVRSMPKWIPGKQKGQPVRTQFNLPIRFKLDSKPAARSKETPAVFGDCSNTESLEACSTGNLLAYVGENLKYPEEARKLGIQGVVAVKMVIGEDGHIKEATFLKQVHPLLDQAALDLVNSMPRWTPATKDGKPVPYEMVLPIYFKLPADDTSVQLSVEPNPAAKSFQVRFKGKPGKAALQVTTIEGKVLKSLEYGSYDGSETTETIRIEDFKGMAVVNLLLDGKVAATTKVMLQ